MARLSKGQKVFLRTVTHHYTGLIVEIDGPWLVLKDAAWIADDGRFSKALETGVFSEIEPYPDGEVLISLGAILDISIWKHDLPRTAK